MYHPKSIEKEKKHIVSFFILCLPYFDSKILHSTPKIVTNDFGSESIKLT